jgi:2-polyprenyl-6-methoxyphenol hydroxylase-like FAD-dependent oxidoreductase
VEERFVLKEIMDSEDFYAGEIVQVKIPRLYNGRVVLVGDARYAAGPTGSGTSLALAGTYILAGELCKHADNLDAGLHGYEQQIRPIIKELEKIPPFILTILAPQTAWGIWSETTLLGL